MPNADDGLNVAHDAHIVLMGTAAGKAVAPVLRPLSVLVRLPSWVDGGVMGVERGHLQQRASVECLPPSGRCGARHAPDGAETVLKNNRRSVADGLQRLQFGADAVGAAGLRAEGGANRRRERNNGP